MSNKNIEDVYPVSPMQEGMLFHSLYETESGVYISQFTCSLKGLNVKVFEQAWQRITERHSVLRTAFVWKGVEKNLQVVGRQVKISVKLHDLRGLSGLEQKERYEAFLREDRKRGFDFSRAPLMRLALLQVSDDTYRFSWSYHHLLLDGWSMATVLQEVFSFYDAFQRSKELSLPLPRPYRDYIGWLRQQDMIKAESYWRRVLAGFNAPTPLHVTRAAGSVPEGDHENNYGKRSRQLGESLTTRLQHLARQHRLTLNTLLQGSWALLLSRYSGERDIVFGTVVSGRPADLAGVESTVGLFINTLPVRIQVEPEAGLFEWLKRLQEQQAEMRQYEHSPLVEVQRWSDVENGVPLFDSYIVFENYTIDEALKDRIEGLCIDDVLSIERSSYPLVLAVLPTKQLTLQIFYERDRFEDATIECMLDHLATLLEAVGADPARQLRQMPLLTAAERHQLLAEWNRTTADYLPDACIHQLIEAQAMRTPHAVAVADAYQRLTYSELDTRSNQLARYLQACGIRPEIRVGLCATQTVDMVVAVLATLKAGGVYVPLDPEHPIERLQFMIEDAAVAVLLTHSQFVNLRPQRAPARVVCLDTDWEAIASQGSQTLVSSVTGNNLAYVIYTSGSTGRPKGVAVPHVAAVNHCRAVQKEYHLEPSDRVLLFASMSFDVSLEQLLPPLMLGARVVLRGNSVWNAAEFVNKLKEEELTIINFPTAYWHQLAQECDASGEMYSKHELKLTIIGGDVILPEAVRLWQKTPARDARLLNAYGPTETVITATLFEIPPGFCDSASRQKIPIGLPVIHRAVYILDQSGEPVPIGVPGELHIGGHLLARGYLNHPALTAEKFIPDAFGETPGARLYKTGDLARRLPDGNIEFLGRIDVQVKIRGFRIELGEIEAALSRHPSIRETVVLVRDDIPGDKQIVAYVVCKNGQPPMTREWRDYLSEWLPDYMLPASFVLLDELPLTPHGKVDKRALATTELSRPKAESDFVAPLDTVEKQIAEIFAAVLSTEQVGSEDDFFELGGHSLLATQAVSRLREKFKIELPFRTLFNEPTVRRLAGIIKRETASKQTPEPVPIRPVKRDGHLPLSFAQQRLWFLDQLEPGSALYNVSGAVRLAGVLNVTAFGRALNEVLHRHESLRTSFNAVDGRPVQVIDLEITLSLPIINLTGLPAAERQDEALRLAAEQARKPFDLRVPPLLRTTLLHLAEEEHIVLLTMHHIVSDGWSLRLLVKEVGALYEALLEEPSSTLPELTIQYADYAVWQHQWLQGDVLEEQLKYWKQQLAGAATLELLTDRARPARQTFNGARHCFTLPEQLTEAIKRLSQQEGATPFMTLLAAFHSLLRRYTGQDDIVIGTPVAGRSRFETEALIGFFVNTLVIRTNIAHDLSFRQMLQHAREVTLAAQTHQDLPFELLVEVLQPARDLSRHPLFQVMFAMQNALLPEIKLRGLTLSSLEVEQRMAKFDLTLEIEEAGQRFEGAFEYNTDLFDKATIERMSNHFQVLLDGIVSNPEQHLSALPLLTRQEREQLLVQWNSTSPLPLPSPFIHRLFEEQAALTPDAVAILCDGFSLSYSLLNSKANQLAHHLLSLGLSPEQPVALCLHR
ncbi:MAG: amino acid adenylation domain-containing protein, partial [Acidobacteria bacterium]|nr:amino acid adenylation domain-containing protein [Acidobacteriota bacterium]